MVFATIRTGPSELSLTDALNVAIEIICFERLPNRMRVQSK